MKYNVIDVDNETWLELLEEPYNGIRYKYGKVEFKEPENEGDDAMLQFDFELYDQRLVVQFKEDSSFHKVIGDILIAIIEEQLERNEVVYTGGV